MERGIRKILTFVICFIASDIFRRNNTEALVLHSQKYYDVMFQMFKCTECYLTKTELRIRFQQASFSRSLYFLILTVYSSYLDEVLLPTAVMPFIYYNKAQEKNLNAHCEFYEYFHVGNACCSYNSKPLSRMQGSREGSSAKRYFETGLISKRLKLPQDDQTNTSFIVPLNQNTFLEV